MFKRCLFVDNQIKQLSTELALKMSADRTQNMWLLNPSSVVKAPPPLKCSCGLLCDVKSITASALKMWKGYKPLSSLGRGKFVVILVEVGYKVKNVRSVHCCVCRRLAAECNSDPAGKGQ